MSEIWTVTPHLFAFGRENSDHTSNHEQSLPGGCSRVDSSKQLSNQQTRRSLIPKHITKQSEKQLSM